MKNVSFCRSLVVILCYHIMLYVYFIILSFIFFKLQIKRKKFKKNNRVHDR